MFGATESKELIKGKFVKKLIKEIVKIWEQKTKKDYISNAKFNEEVNRTFHNIIIENDN